MQGVKWTLSKIFVTIASLRRDKRPAVRMGDALNVVGKVLLVLPLDEDDRQQVLPQVFGFKAGFPNWKLDLLFLGGSVPTTEDEFKGIGIVRAGMDDLSPLGLPGRELLGRLRDSQYDLAIDLSMSLHPLVPYLLERTRVPLRMGINDSGRLQGRFNNLNIRLKDSEDVMTRLADTLAPICRAGNT